MKNKFIMLCCAVVLLFNQFSLTANAVEKVVPLNFTVIPTEVDITVPLNITATINPNIEDGFICADNLTITNNSKVPIDLKVSDFTEVTDVFENDILPTELPEGLNWDSLSVENSKKYFSIGMKAADSAEWFRCDCTDMVYAKTINDAGDGITVGVVNSEGSVNLKLDATYGRAFERNESVQYNIVWVGTLHSD